MNPPAISAWPPPRSAICSGTSTSTAPNITEGIATNAVAIRIGRLKMVSATSRRSWRSGAFASGSAGSEDGEHDGDPKHRAENQLGADFRRERSQGGAEQGAGDGCSQGGADHRAAALRRRGADQPGQRARPDQRPGAPLDEASGVEQERTRWRSRRRRWRHRAAAGRRSPCGADRGERRADPRAARRAGFPRRRRRRARQPAPCSSQVRRRNPAAAAQSPRRRRRRRRPSPRRV